MKNVKKVLILALAVLMMANALTACNGSNKKSTETTGTSASASTAAETSMSSAPPEEVYPDFQGKTVTVACWADAIKPVLGKSEFEDAKYYAREWAKEKYNCNIEYVILPESEYFTTFASNTAAGIKFADIVTAHCWHYIGEIQKGYYLPVTEWMSKADPKRWDLGVSAFKNEIYGINPMPYVNWPYFYLVYNTELLAELNLESPQKLAREGKWNWDTFRSYCKAAVADTDGDSEIDRFGVSAFMLPDILRYSDNIEPYTLVDGEFKNAYTHPSTKDKMLNLLTLIAEMKLEDKSVLGDTTGGMPVKDEMMETFRNGKLLFAVGDYMTTTTTPYKKEGIKNFAPVTLPLGPNTKKVDNHIEAFSFSAIPKFKDFETEDLVRFWMDCQTTWDPSRENAYYMTNDDTEIEFMQSELYLTREDTQFMFDMARDISRVGSYTWSLGIGSIEVWDIYAQVLRGTKTPASVLEATDGPIQSKLDEVLNKKAE